MKLIVKDFKDLTNKELYEILSSRAEIFQIEQKIHYNDLDRIDYDSYHFFIQKNEKVIAYLRAYYEDDNKERLRIGRVLTRNHGNGIGKELLNDSIDFIKKNIYCKLICMDAQSHAIEFYKKFGFKVTSEEFLEEGVPHVKMELEIRWYNARSIYKS